MRWICWIALKKLSRYFSLVSFKFLDLHYLAALKHTLGWMLSHLSKGVRANMSQMSLYLLHITRTELFFHLCHADFLKS